MKCWAWDAERAPVQLEQAELGADQSERGDDGRLAAQHAGAEMHEGKAVSAQRGAVGRPPAALGTEGDHDGCAADDVTLAEGAGGLVVVEGEAPGRGGRKRGEGGGEGVVARHGREARGEGLGGAGEAVAAPFAGSPECGGGVVGIAALGGDEVKRADAEGRGIAENVAGSLRARQAEEERDGIGGGGRRAPREGEREGGGGDGVEGAFTDRAVDEADVEGVSDPAAESFQNVLGARVGVRERDSELGGLEENEVHGGVAWIETKTRPECGREWRE